MAARQRLKDAAQGALGGLVVSIVFLLIGLMRAAVHMARGNRVDFGGALTFVPPYIGILVLAGVLGRVLWGFAEDKATQVLACVFAGAPTGALMMVLATGESDRTALWLGGLVGVFFGLVFGLSATGILKE